jgi:aerobic carbon-monoxide dehydrogenase medium subunit
MTIAPEPAWHAPRTLPDALRLRADLGDDATVVAGGTFTGILVGQGLLRPSAFLSIADVSGLDDIEPGAELRLGAMVRHRAVERSPQVRRGWGALARAFEVVASPRVRNQATVGGVLCDADYASDPPAMLVALGARAVLASVNGTRALPVEELITGHYTTRLGSDELLTEVVVPPPPARSTYLKFRSRSSEDRPCAAVAATADLAPDGECRALRVVVGAVSDRPRLLREVCALATGRRLGAELGTEIGRAYADRIPALSDARGSEAYRRRVMATLVRRAIEEVGAS